MNTVMKTLVVAALAAVATPAFTLAAVPSSATQNVPGTMNYQGYLADPTTGAAYADGIYTLDIRIWNSDVSTAAAACLWGGRYSVYVKDGYFNLMLGDSSAAELTSADGVVPTYKNADLWKALWGASATDTVRYLGVTPRQNAKHANITSPTEIAPRQQLLTSPFAFRAQHAQYADQAQAGFSVPGNLTVSGSATVKGTISGPIAASAGSSLGPVKTSSSTVNLGNGYTSATSENSSSLPASVYDVGKYLYFYSYYSMYFKPTAGSMNFTVPSGYYMNVTGAGTFRSEAVNNMIGGTGATKISGRGASSLDLKGSGAMTIESTGGNATLKSASNTTVEGSKTTVSSTNNDLWLKSSADIDFDCDNLYFSDSGSFNKPIKIRKVSVTIPAGQKVAYYTLDESVYKWMVGGWTPAVANPVPAGNSLVGVACMSVGNGRSLILELNKSHGAATVIYVTLVGFHAKMVRDER